MKIEVKVIPNAKSNELIETESGYKARLTAQPVDYKANEALVELLAKKFDVPKRNIKILKGETSRNKIIEIIKNVK